MPLDSSAPLGAMGRLVEEVTQSRCRSPDGLAYREAEYGNNREWLRGYDMGWCKAGEES